MNKRNAHKIISEKLRSSNTRVWVFAVLALSILFLAGCNRAGSADPAFGRQISGNQALVLLLQNSQDLDHLYLPYAGSTTPGSSGVVGMGGGGSGGSVGTVQVGEINLMLRNVGGSSTAGRLYVSGYNPELIEIRSRVGENPINSQGSNSACTHNVVVTTSGQYDVSVFCQDVQGISVGGRTSTSGGGLTGITLGNLPLDAWANQVASQVTGQNVNWFTQNGFFGSGRVDCDVQGPNTGCRITFGNPSANPNRALYGYLLLNMLYGEITSCQDNCRIFPQNFATGQVLRGLSDEYPNGDALYANYDIFVKREAWPPLLNDMNQRLQITACYYYTTTITPVVCIDPDPSTRANDPCDASRALIWKGSQGAPIQVSRIQPRSVPGGTIFDIQLRHTGSGQFWQPGSLDQCGPYGVGRPDYSRQQAVQLLDARVAGDLARMSCTPTSDDGSNIIRFQNGVGSISCYYPLSATPVQSRQAFMTPLTLEFGYLYQNVISKDIKIHRI